MLPAVRVAMLATGRRDARAAGGVPCANRAALESLRT